MLRIILKTVPVFVQSGAVLRAASHWSITGSYERHTDISKLFHTRARRGRWWKSSFCQKALPRNLAGRWNKTSEESGETEEAGAAKALICCSVCLHKLTRCNFSTCQQQLTRKPCVWLCVVYVCVCAGVFLKEFLFFSLPRQHRYSWLSRIAGLWGIKRTQTLSLRHSFSHTHPQSWNSPGCHPCPVGIVTV